MTLTRDTTYVRAASLAELRAVERLVVHVHGNTVCLIAADDRVFAVDNRCPHMGFPLHRGSVADGILTCHWHHARFDLCTGGTFDQWADNLRRFPVGPLPGEAPPPPERLARWFRRFVEVRDSEGAERAVVSAVRTGASPAQLADMLFAAATDHRYLDGGHTLDFVNKALEALDVAGWDKAQAVLPSLCPQLAAAERMEESNAWRNPVDIVALLESAFERLPAEPREEPRWDGRKELVKTVLNADADVVLDALLAALDEGSGALRVASAVT